MDGAAEDPNVRYLALTGVLTSRAAHDLQIEPAIKRLKSIFPSPSPAFPIILHRREVMRREGPFAILRDDGMRAAFDNQLADVITNAPYLVITVQIDKRQHLEMYNVWRFDPYHYCLRCLIERFVLELHSRGLRGDVVIEPRFKKADKKVKASFERIYNEGTEHVPANTIQAHLSSRDIMFEPKKANVAGLQLADMLAHPSARYMRFERDGVPHPDDFGTRVAKILVDRKYRRNPFSGNIAGWGTKWLP